MIVIAAQFPLFSRHLNIYCFTFLVFGNYDRRCPVSVHVAPPSGQKTVVYFLILVLVLPGYHGAGGPGEDQRGAEEQSHGRPRSGAAQRRERARRERREQRRGQRRVHVGRHLQGPQRRGAHDRGGEERAPTEAPTGTRTR